MDPGQGVKVCKRKREGYSVGHYYLHTAESGPSTTPWNCHRGSHIQLQIVVWEYYAVQEAWLKSGLGAWHHHTHREAREGQWSG